MKKQAIFTILLLLSAFLLYEQGKSGMPDLPNKLNNISIGTIGNIPPPAGFERVTVQPGSFGDYLRGLTLKKDKTVYLYDGTMKKNQSAQYAVVDISTGTKDLQQCADAIMRLRAEYYFGKHDFKSIKFPASKSLAFNFADYVAGTRYVYKGNNVAAVKSSASICDTHDCLLKFMETVFINCGTYTVDEMTHAIPMKDLQPGDLYVKGGAPGHAMLIVDVAVNKATGKKAYLLLQSYMPAQDMHIVVNPNDANLSPWYEVNDNTKIVTPEWMFDAKQLKRF